MTKRVVEADNSETIQNLHFFYDAQSKPAFVEYEGAMFRYIHNLQGDIVAIVDTAGIPVVEYKYDAWGKPISTTGSLKTTLGELNPFRYRGYVWDIETDLYYLRSRYYNSICNRFVNSDALVGIRGNLLSHNIICYCCNSVIVNIDSSGCGKTHVFYYYHPDSNKNLNQQALNSPYFDVTDTENVVLHSVSDASSFVNEWNAMEGEIDDVYLYLHGGAGEFYLYNETVDINDANNALNGLNSKEIKGVIYLFSCKGASTKNGRSVAEFFCSKFKTEVIACSVGVTYGFTTFARILLYRYPRIDDGLYARTQTLFYGAMNKWRHLKYNQTTGKVITSIIFKDILK